MSLFNTMKSNWTMLLPYLVILGVMLVLNWSLVWNFGDNPILHLMLLASVVLAQRAWVRRSGKYVPVVSAALMFLTVAVAYYIIMAMTGTMNHGTGPWRGSSGMIENLGSLLLASSLPAFCLSLGAYLQARATAAGQQPRSSSVES